MPKSVFQAVSEVMNDVREVRKGDRNSQQGFNFRGIDAVMNAAGPALRKHGVIIAPISANLSAELVEAGKKKAKDTSGKVALRWFGPEGDYFDTEVFAEGRDYADKGGAKTMSVALRTCILQTLCLPTDDPDPDEDYIKATGLVGDVLGGSVAPTVEQLKGRIVEIMKAEGIPPADVMAMYKSAGGVREKFMDADDVEAVQAVLDALDGP